MSILICTDLDRTLIPNGPQSESENARAYFTALAGHTEIQIAYVSGRHQKLIQEAIKNYSLPQPDFVIGDVGTTLYEVGPEQDWAVIESWQAHIAADWEGVSHADIKALLADMSALRIQEAKKQNRFKLSYFVPLQYDFDGLSQQINQRLESLDIKARLVWSVDQPAGIGLLDILPRSASKYHAIEALLTHLQLQAEQCVFCGDSGNDIDVLASPLQSVLVANAQEHVKQLALDLVQENQLKPSLYIAEGGFMGMNGYYAAGMLEGINHYFPNTESWVKQEFDKRCL